MSERNQPFKKQILVIDDDPAIQKLLLLYLVDNGFDVDVVNDGKSMRAWLENHKADLLIMDLMLPGEDGLQLTQQLRLGNNIPIIMLTAKTDEIDKIIGLEVGADDYLPKPFNPRELLARIKAILRRVDSIDYKTKDLTTTNLMFDDFILNMDKLELKHKNKIIELTTGDFDLLTVLINHPEKNLSREKIMNELNLDNSSSFDRSIDVRITRLRKKIEIEPTASQIIQTIRGKGYRFNRKVISQ